MSTTLYRKYRPQSFAEIVNQEHVKGTIQQEIKSGKIPHAFLFCGPRGTGKTTTARVIAKALNCKKRKEGDAEPCNACASCDAMNGGASLALVEVDAASQTGVDNVRDNIIANARVAVKSDEYKIFIIDEVHMLSTSSFNALLKTLEEPPERVVFILATTELHKIPETILSRCQRFDFHPLRADVLQPYLAEIVKREKRKVDEDVLAAIVKKSGGYVRDAMSLLGQVLTLSGKIDAQAASLILPVPQKEHVITLIDHISQRQTKEALLHVHAMEAQGVRMLPFTQEVIEFAHALMLAVVGSHPAAAIEGVAGAEKDRVESMQKRYTPVSVLRLLDVLMRRYQQMKSSDQGSVPLQLAVIELCEMDGTAAASAATPPAARPTSTVVREAPRTTVAPAPQLPITESRPAEKPAPKAVRANVPAKAEAAPTPSAPVGSGPLASYADVQPQWTAIMNDVSEAQHSLFIVLRTAVFREGKDKEPELAFRYRMHHDLVKRSILVLQQESSKHLPNMTIRFTLCIDENLASTMSGDVEEPKSSETAALGAELGRLAEAFGGTVIE